MEKPELYQLIEKYINDEATPEEKSRLRAWYDSINEDEIEWLSGSLNEEEQTRDRILQELRTRMAGAGRKKMPRIGNRKIAVAASVLLVICSSVFFVLNRRSKEARGQITVHNPAGKIVKINLPDGSQVWLNANSTLRYAKHFEENREIELEGEGFFDVKTMHNRPFVVHTAQLSTRVLGTAFDILAYPNQKKIEVIVQRGKVAVRDEREQKDLAVLLPNQEIVYQKAYSRAEVHAANRSIDWKNGKLEFESNTLEEITAKLENWYNVRFAFSNDALKLCQYNASFNNTIPLKELLALLCDINSIQFAIDETNHLVTLSGKGCN